MPDHHPYTAVLFDLDGAIVDSAAGITASLAHTFETLGLPVPTPAELLEWVGPPILESFRDRAGFDEAQTTRALAIYRESYVPDGAYDATVYDGVPEVLRAIQDARLPLSLATSKPETPARLILEHFDLAKHFDHLTGASDDEVRSAKADVVAEALRRLREDGADLTRPVMIGDRVYDIEGAAVHDVPTIAVAWGYGSAEEHVGAVAIAETPDDLYPLLGLDP